MEEDELGFQNKKKVEEVLEKRWQKFNFNDELFIIYLLSVKKDYEKGTVSEKSWQVQW